MTSFGLTPARMSPARLSWRIARDTDSRAVPISRASCSCVCSSVISIPAGVYSIFMFLFAALWGTFLTRARNRAG